MHKFGWYRKAENIAHRYVNHKGKKHSTSGTYENTKINHSWADGRLLGIAAITRYITATAIPIRRKSARVDARQKNRIEEGQRERMGLTAECK